MINVRAKKKLSVLVAMSGGVDSSVACHLLLEAGYEVRGATIRTWETNGCETAHSRSCCARDGVEDARRVARALNIPYYVFNFQREFRENVIDYFSREYMKGRTPNPCIACNNHIKFRLFLRRAQAFGMDYIATGHYARITRDEVTGRHLLREGNDPNKDQSYVLFGLDQDVLNRTLLPCGEYRKEKIRDIAKQLGLVNAEKPDSMEICFIPKNNYREFLKKNAGAKEQKGLIRSTAGEVLGEHTGFFNYTVGQRRGLGIAAKEPLYVKELHPETNEVIVGTQEEVFRTTFRVSDMNWIAELNGKDTYEFDVKIRSRHPKARAWVKRLDDRTVEVSFAEPQDAVTPGQAAVFYDGDVVVGGGWIC